MLVQHAVQSPRLVDISGHAVLDLLRRIAYKVVRLTLHRAQAGVLPEQPIVHLVLLAATLGETDLVLGIILLGQVGEDATPFEQANLLAIGECIRQCGDPAVGVDFEKPGLLLSVGRDVDVFGLVRDAELLEGDGDLDPVGCGVGVQCYIGARHGVGVDPSVLRIGVEMVNVLMKTSTGCAATCTRTLLDGFAHVR